MGLLTDRINNKLEKSNLINEHSLNRSQSQLDFQERYVLLLSAKISRRRPGGSTEDKN